MSIDEMREEKILIDARQDDDNEEYFEVLNRFVDNINYYYKKLYKVEGV